MIDEQQVAYATIKKLVENTIKTDKKHTVIVQGGPGTGKSVIAINLLSYLIQSGYNVEYVTKNAAPRSVFVAELIKKNLRKDMLRIYLRDLAHLLILKLIYLIVY